MNKQANTKLNKVFWLWVPVIFIFGQILIEIFLPQKTLTIMHSENGPHEMLQFLIMVLAFITSIYAIRFIDWSTQKLHGIWLALAAVCCFYVAGEEVSWGQHFFDWATPEFWHEVNDQQETNFHNTSSWLDQKPRLVLEIGVIVGGLIFPLLLKYKPHVLPTKFSEFYPPACLWVIALLAIIPKILEKIAESVDIILFERVSEVQELYFFYFVLLYLLVFKARLKHES